MKTKYTMHIRPLLLGLALAGAVAVGAAGCSHIMVTDNTRGEVRFGAVQVAVDYSFDDAYQAALAGMKDRGLFLVKNDKGAMTARLSARDRADTQVWVEIDQVAAKRSNLSIRYGLTGNLAESQTLFEAIKKHL